MLPCCSQPRGFPGEDGADMQLPPFDGGGWPEHNFPAGPDAGSGAFLKLRGALAASQARQQSSSPCASETPAHRRDGLVVLGGAPESPAAASAHGLSPSSGDREGPGAWIGSLSNSVATLGSNLGMPGMVQSPSPTAATNNFGRESPTSILKDRSSPVSITSSRSGDASINTERKSVSTASPRPMSARGSITGRASSVSAISTRRASAGRMDNVSVRGKLPESEVKNMSAKVAELVRGGKTQTSALEQRIYALIAQRDAHVMMAWTVYQVSLPPSLSSLSAGVAAVLLLPCSLSLSLSHPLALLPVCSSATETTTSSQKRLKSDAVSERSASGESGTRMLLTISNRIHGLPLVRWISSYCARGLNR